MVSMIAPDISPAIENSSDIGKYKTSPHALGIYFAFPFVDTKKALNATDDANAFALGPARFS
ncbi:MAG: hypothetical protein RR505_14965, partial [Raoultibacter sp.]